LRERYFVGTFFAMLKALECTQQMHLAYDVVIQPLLHRRSRA